MARKKIAKADVKQEILKSAKELFIKKGFDNTTISDIAEKAGVGKGSVYNHYFSKETIYSEIYSESLSIYLDYLISSIGVKGDKGIEVIKKLFILTDEFDRKSPEITYIIVNDKPIKDLLIVNSGHISHDLESINRKFNDFLEEIFSCGSIDKSISIGNDCKSSAQVLQILLLNFITDVLHSNLFSSLENKEFVKSSYIFHAVNSFSARIGSNQKSRIVTILTWVAILIGLVDILLVIVLGFISKLNIV